MNRSVKEIGKNAFYRQQVLVWSWNIFNGGPKLDRFLKHTRSKILHKYSSVPNRRAVQNKRAGGKIVSKSINVQTKMRPCRGEFFLKINKRAD